MLAAAPTLMRDVPSVADAPARMLALHAADPARYPVLLDSAATGGALGRFSLLLAAPGERAARSAGRRMHASMVLARGRSSARA